MAVDIYEPQKQLAIFRYYFLTIDVNEAAVHFQPGSTPLKPSTVNDSHLENMPIYHLCATPYSLILISKVLRELHGPTWNGGVEVQLNTRSGRESNLAIFSWDQVSQDLV